MNLENIGSDVRENHEDHQSFFTKLLHQCSNENPKQEQPMSAQINLFNSQSIMTHRQNNSNAENWLWNQEEMVAEKPNEVDEEHFERAKSLRIQQQRKINNFMSVFGIPKSGGQVGSIRTFSPQKTKKINKFSKQGNK